MLPPSFALPASLIVAEGGVAPAVGWSFVVIAFVIGGFYTIAWVRRWMKEDDITPIGIGFTLGDLRDLHRRGEMTDEEFEKAKAKIVHGTQVEAEKIVPAGPAAKDSAEAIRARTAARRAAGGMPPPLRPPSDKPR